MFPYTQIGTLKISNYILFIMIGFIFYILYMTLILKKEKYSTSIINKMLIVSVVCFGILYAGAFLMNSIFHSIESGYIVIGGITWLGGVIIAFPSTIFIIYKFIPELRGKALYTFSLIIPGIVLAHAFGRIGCFLGGCCYGELTNSILGVSFPPGSLAAMQYPAYNGYSLKVLPTQLFEALFELILFAFMCIFFKKYKSINYEIYGIGYSLFRFILEFLRGDSRGSTGFFLTPSQLMSIVLLFTAVIIILYKKNIIFKNLKLKIQLGYNNDIKDKKALRVLNKSYDLYCQGALTLDEYNYIKSKVLK